MDRQLTVFDAASRALRLRAGPQGGMAVSVGSGRWMTLWSSGDGDLLTGDWQKDIKLPVEASLAFFAVYACITQIAGDIAKLCLRLMEQTADGIWLPTQNSAYSPFLRKPNHYQTMQQFVECWMISKLSRGNVYVLLERDASRKVRAQYILDPDRVTPLVAMDGSVFYQLRTDDLSHVPEATITVPASEIIHDRMNCLFHPLIGVSPLYACAIAAKQGLAIQANSAKFFANSSRPGGIITAPRRIEDIDAKRIKEQWETGYGGANSGRTAVMGDGMEFKPLATTPVDAALVDQLKLSAEQVCAAFSVPKFMIGLEKVEAVANVQALTQWYYGACLQELIVAFQNLQDEGLALADSLCVAFDLDDLLRMDTKTLAEVEGVLVQRGISSPDEARAKFNRPPVEGGATPYLQQQNFSLSALAKRDSGADPFGSSKPAPAAPAPPETPPQDGEARAAAAAAQRDASEARAAVQRLLDEAQAARDVTSKAGEINLARLIVAKAGVQLHGRA